ncbi:hydrolase [Jatrophihabitans fulvus]
MRLRLSLVLASVVAAAACGSSVVHPQPATAADPPYRVLFDDTSAQEAGNADWIISTSKPDPTAQDPAPASETDWTGGISAWGVALQKTGDYELRTQSSGSITYGGTGSLDLKNFDAFVIPEPNILFTASEKTAIMTFVENGGGLFMISDHDQSDRNNDGSDSVDVLNDLMTNNSVDSTDPFGFSIDYANIANEDPDVIGSAAPSAVVNGPFGTVTGTILRNGTTATLKPSDNANAHGVVYRSGSSASGTTGAVVATSTFGSGRVAFWGDSSPIDDGTGQSGNTLYDGWNDPAGTNAAIALNATQWLAGGTATGGGGTGGGGTGSSLTNGGFESGTSGWTVSSGAYAVTSQHHSGTHSLHLGATTNATDTASQTVTVPSSGTLTWWTRMTTTESSGTHDTLTVKLGGTTVGAVSNTATTGAWQSHTASLASYAGQSVTLAFSAANDASSPTTFWVDDVAVG